MKFGTSAWGGFGVAITYLIFELLFLIIYLTSLTCAHWDLEKLWTGWDDIWHEQLKWVCGYYKIDFGLLYF